jgi:hypothetical protein
MFRAEDNDMQLTLFCSCHLLLLLLPLLWQSLPAAKKLPSPCCPVHAVPNHQAHYPFVEACALAF